MHIIAGSMKGKIIPFDNKKFGGADTTMQMTKEAVFAILSQRLQSSVFLDLFACSGQIGLEALSRGASFVLFNESERRRSDYLRGVVKSFGIGDVSAISNFSWERCIKRCAEDGRVFDLIYCDPPYIKKPGPVPLYADILTAIGQSGILAADGRVIAQYHYGNILESDAGSFIRLDERKYGQTGISIYGSIQT